MLLRIRQTLLVPKDRIAKHECERNQNDRETNTRDAQQPLDVLVRCDGRISDGCTNGVVRDKRERVAVDGRGGGFASDVVLEGFWEDLVPEGPGDRVAEGSADVVGCEE